MKLQSLVLCAALAIPGVAWSAQCDEDLTKADAGLAAGPKADVSAEDFEKARGMVTKARELLTAGDDVGCVAAVGQALDLMDLGGEEG